MRLSRHYGFCAQGGETSAPSRTDKNMTFVMARSPWTVRAVCRAQMRDQQRAECLGATRRRNMPANVHRRVAESEIQAQKIRPSTSPELGKTTIPAAAMAPTFFNLLNHGRLLRDQRDVTGVFRSSSVQRAHSCKALTFRSGIVVRCLFWIALGFDPADYHSSGGLCMTKAVAKVTTR